MPYPADHSARTRARIVECARILFNRHGYDNVSIDRVMQAAELTRGGFYHHFSSKEDLFAAAVSGFLMGRGKRWRDEAGVNAADPALEDAAHMLRSYLSPDHLGDLDGQCPMIALPSDVARAAPAVRDAYGRLAEAMTGLYERALPPDTPDRRQSALALSALSVGGMILARTLEDSALGAEIRQAALDRALGILGRDADEGAASP